MSELAKKNVIINCLLKTSIFRKIVTFHNKNQKQNAKFLLISLNIRIFSINLYP